MAHGPGRIDRAPGARAGPLLVGKRGSRRRGATRSDEPAVTAEPVTAEPVTAVAEPVASTVPVAPPAVTIAPVAVSVPPATIAVAPAAEQVADHLLAEAEPGAERRSHEQRREQPAPEAVEVTPRPRAIVPRRVPVLRGATIDHHLSPVRREALADPHSVGGAHGHGPRGAVRRSPRDVLGRRPMARIEEARWPALGRRPPLEVGLGARHRVATLLERLRHRGEVLRALRPVEDLARSLVGL